MFLNIQIDLLIIKTYYGQFTLTTKRSLHIIFKGQFIKCGGHLCVRYESNSLPAPPGECSYQFSASEVTTIWRYTNVYIIIIIILRCGANRPSRQ